jgi:hypothetical protein
MERSTQAEHGQTLVIFVFAIVGLLAMVGLAIDGGTVFLERRRMQNAADAAALAGTRQLAELMCDAAINAHDGDQYILSEVRKYAQKNGVRNPSTNAVAEYVRFDGDDNVVPFTPQVLVGNSLSGGDGIPDGAAGISATVKIERSTHFVTLIGIHTAGASAPAVAVTGPLAAGGGLRPFGVPIELVIGLDPDDPDNNAFSISFKNDGGEICWADRCVQHRGWMNLGYAWNQGENDAFPRAVDDSTSASDLKEWMRNGWQGTLYADCLWFVDDCGWGDYVHAKPGTNSSAICQAPDTEIIIPVYDYIPDCPQEPIPDPKPDCPTQGSAYAYHIVGFAGTRITECSQGGGGIEAELVRLIMGQGVPSPNGGYGHGVCEKTALITVTLWE